MKIVYNTGESEEDLRVEYNPEGSELKKVQDRLLDMLIYLDSVCRKLNVQYSLVYGNVLGAVRHRGFIPWDDDVDVMIPKKDYNRLCNYLREHPHQQYVLQSCETDSGSIRFWNTLRDTKSRYIHRQKDPLNDVFKYQGLQIDLFCFAPGIIPFLHSLSCVMAKTTIPKLVGKSFYIAKFVYIFLKLIVFPVFNLISFIFGDKNTYMRTYGNGPHTKYNANVLFPVKEIDFEGHKFFGPANPIAYLEVEFGSWKDLPPKEKRRKHDVDYVFYD